MNPGSDEVVVRRATLSTADRYGKRARDWSAATSHTVAGVSVQALSAVEQVNDREYAATRVRMYAPYDADINATDRVTWRGNEFEVDGEPFQWADDVGQADHLYVILKRLTG